MLTALLALLLTQAPATSDARIAVFLTAPTRDGFIDTTKDVEDSINDIRKAFKNKKDMRLVDRPEDADLTLVVIARGVGSEEYGERRTKRDTRYDGVVIEDTPIVANTFWLSTVLQSGRYRKEFVGRRTQESPNSLGAWTDVADSVAKQVESWASANQSQLRSRRK